MNKLIIPGVFIALLVLQCSCKENAQTTEAETASESPKALVKTAQVVQGDIEETIRFSGNAVYLRKNSVVSPINGYLTKVTVQWGDKVRKGDPLFEIQTKENKAMEQAGLNENLPGGTIKVLAPANGIIEELNVLSAGAYITEGSPLCTVVEDKDIMVMLSVPFEYRSIVRLKNSCTLLLPDGTQMSGYIDNILPTMDQTTQTQNVLIRPSNAQQIPENLNLTVQFVKARHQKSLLISKQALLTNEVQSEFWVMKVVHDSLAIIIPVTKGIDNNGMVEVSSPGLLENDTVIIEGGYGLPDSTIVQNAN